MKPAVFLMACQRQQAKGQLECTALLFMYDACSFGYLVTLLSISNRRSRIFSEGRAARSREARVEPECQGRSIITHREESNSSGRNFVKTTVERWCGELHWTVGKEKTETVRRLFGCLDYTHSPLRVKTPKQWNIVTPFPRKSRHGGIYVSTAQVSHFFILHEQLTTKILRLSARNGGGGRGGVLGYFASDCIKIIHSVSLKTESGV